MVTPEMIEAGRRAWQSAIKDRNLDQWLEQIYLAMKALDPEVERLRLLLSCAQTYVKLVAENGKSTIAEELFFAIKGTLSQTQSQAQDDER